MGHQLTGNRSWVRPADTVTTTHRFATAEAPSGLLDQVRRLMDDAFDVFTEGDWDHVLGGDHLAVTERDRVVAHGAVVPRTLFVNEHPLVVGYLEAVAVARDHHGGGLGSTLVAQLTGIVRREFAMGALATGRHSFYERLGWERWQGPTSVLVEGTTVRTPDDDDAVMVLRHGPSATVKLASPITCETRPGDPW